jgi:hypothetical protein
MPFHLSAPVFWILQVTGRPQPGEQSTSAATRFVTIVLLGDQRSGGWSILLENHPPPPDPPKGPPAFTSLPYLYVLSGCSLHIVCTYCLSAVRQYLGDLHSAILPTIYGSHMTAEGGVNSTLPSTGSRRLRNFIPTGCLHIIVIEMEEGGANNEAFKQTRTLENPNKRGGSVGGRVG